MLFLAALCVSSACASPWSRNQKRGDGWGSHKGGHKTSDDGWGWGEKTSSGNGVPGGYGSTSASEGGPWGYGSTCVASTVTETEKASTVTLPGSTVYVTGHETTVTLPGSTYTSVSTIVKSASCSSIPVGPVTECATTLTQTNCVTKTAPGYNQTATETSVVTAPGKTVTAYQ